MIILAKQQWREISMHLLATYLAGLALDITVNEIFTAVHHLLFPGLPGENVQTVLAVLRDFDVDKEDVFFDPISRVAFLNRNSLIFL